MRSHEERLRIIDRGWSVSKKKRRGIVVQCASWKFSVHDFFPPLDSLEAADNRMNPTDIDPMTLEV